MYVSGDVIVSGTGVGAPTIFMALQGHGSTTDVLGSRLTLRVLNVTTGQIMTMALERF